MTESRATLGGGCFWCLEAVFEMLRGVTSVKSGYAGGEKAHPTYREVCNGTTGHAEVVQLTFDPERVTFEELLQVFFTAHDPTTLNRQGADIGTQYRSIVLYHDEEQRETAERVIAEMEAGGPWSDPIVTQVEPLERFWPAEEYHDEYYRRNRDQPYCRAVIDPKVAKVRKAFLDRLKDGAG